MRFNIPHGNTLRKPFISNLKGDDVRTRMNEAEIASESSVQKFVNKVSCSRTVPNFKSILRVKKRDIHKYFRIVYYYIYTYPLEVSLASIFDREFLSPVRNQTFQPQNLYNLTVYTTNEREKREKEKKIARKFSTVGHSSVSSSEKERVKKRDREKEENNKFLSLPFSLESKCI